MCICVLCVYMCIYVCVHIYIYIHTHIHIHRLMKLQPSFYFKPQVLLWFYSILIKKNTKQSRTETFSWNYISSFTSNTQPPVVYQWPQDRKRSVFIPIPKKGNAKQCSNYRTIVLISHISKVVLKILQARLQQSMNCELPDVQAGFRKARGSRDQIANIHFIIEKARQFQKNIYFCFIDCAKAFDCVDHNKLWKILRDGNTRLPDLPPKKSVWRAGSNS